MTSDEQDAILAAAGTIKSLVDLIDAVDSAYRHSGDSVSGHIPIQKRLAKVVEQHLSAEMATALLDALRHDAIRALNDMQFPRPKAGSGSIPTDSGGNSPE